jgi:hypothetical protein
MLPSHAASPRVSLWEKLNPGVPQGHVVTPKHYDTTSKTSDTSRACDNTASIIDQNDSLTSSGDSSTRVRVLHRHGSNRQVPVHRRVCHLPSKREMI